jgi:hypothetical protein
MLGLKFKRPPLICSLATRFWLYNMADGYAEQWPNFEALAKCDLGLEHASPPDLEILTLGT